MKIGIDISQIVYEGTGVARFTHGLVEAILNYDQDNQWVFFFSSLRKRVPHSLEERIASKNHQLVKIKIPVSLLANLWNNLHLVTVDSFVGKLDWFITSDWTEPPSKIKKATIVHDLTYLRYPQTVDKIIKVTQQKRLSWVKRESKIIFADSQATRRDLASYLKIDEKKIIVNYPGVEMKKTHNKTLDSTLKKYRLKKPFILTVGKLEPRKNLNRLIDAYTNLETKNIDLVIIGPKGWDTSISQSVKKLDNVKILGYVEDDDLYNLYSSCLFFVYPSIWEGFGYPMVEAMKLGVPVAASNTSSMKEIGEGAVLLFDPFKTEEIKNAMEKMINNEDLRQKLITEGKNRSNSFSWKSYYDKMVKTLNVSL